MERIRDATESGEKRDAIRHPQFFSGRLSKAKRIVATADSSTIPSCRETA